MSSNTTEYIKKFYKLFEKYNFYCNVFYVVSKTNKCKFIGCTHSLTGYRILVEISNELNIIFDKYVSSTIDNIIIIEEQSLDNIDTIVDEMYLAKKYKTNDIDNIDISSHNLNDVLLEEYKHNINLNTQSVNFMYNLNDCYNQVNRLKHIISPVTHYGICIESNNILVYTELNSTNIKAYKLSKQPIESRILYILLSLDIFYDKRKTIDDIVKNIHNGIINVLNHNFLKQIALLKSLVKKCDESLENIEYIHKKQLEYESKYNKLDNVQKIDDVIDRIRLLNKIDCIGLCIDKIMFDNIISYNTIINNYELLIKMEHIL